jgi:hypothetical protein
LVLAVVVVILKVRRCGGRRRGTRVVTETEVGVPGADDPLLTVRVLVAP